MTDPKEIIIPLSDPILAAAVAVAISLGHAKAMRELCFAIVEARHLASWAGLKARVRRDYEGVWIPLD